MLLSAEGPRDLLAPNQFYTKFLTWGCLHHQGSGQLGTTLIQTGLGFGFLKAELLSNQSSKMIQSFLSFFWSMEWSGSCSKFIGEHSLSYIFIINIIVLL